MPPPPAPPRVHAPVRLRPARRRVPAPARALAAALTVIVAAGCGAEPGAAAEPDLGPIDDSVDEVARTVWPGVVGADGVRFIRRLNGFFDGGPTAYWFSGFAPRFTADLFVFCRDDDAACPLDDDGVFAYDRAIGRPVFSRIPGENGYSPYWKVKIVRVAGDYAADDLKSVFGIERAVADGRALVEPARVDGEELIVHCLLVLTGTELQGNGADLVGRPGEPSMPIPVQRGWHQRYQVEFYDFVPSEGMFAPAISDDGAEVTPSANIYVMFRDCAGGSTAPLCDRATGLLGAVTERGVEQDLTGDGDKSDTNNIIAAFPGTEPRDPQDQPYSPLWRVQVVTVAPERDDEVALIDSTADQDSSGVKDVAAMRALIADGALREPTPMSEEQAGDAVPGNEGEVYFNCPSQVPAP